MTTCLGNSCLFDVPRVSFVNAYQFVYVHLSLLGLTLGSGLASLAQKTCTLESFPFHRTY